MVLHMSLALIVPVALGLVGVVLVGYGLRQFAGAYVIRSRPPSPAMDATKGGRIELEGTAAVADETIESPFTGTECLVCEYEVEEYRSSGKSSSWRTIDEDVLAVPFLLDDDTGSVTVDPAGARFELSREYRTKVRGGHAPPARIRSFIEGNPSVDSENTSIDLKVFELNTGNSRRYSEYRLDPGEPVHVVGHAEYGAGARAGNVNAIVGAFPSSGRSSPLGRLRDRFTGPMFVVSDTDEHGAAWRVAKSGIVAAGIGTVLLGFVALMNWP